MSLTSYRAAPPRGKVVIIPLRQGFGGQVVKLKYKEVFEDLAPPYSPMP